MDELVIRRYFRGECSVDERELVVDYLSDPRYASEAKSLLHKHWDAVDMDSAGFDVETDHILGKVHHLIHLQANKRAMTRPFLTRVYNQYSKVAALILLPLLLLSAWLISSLGLFQTIDDQVFVEVIAPPAARTHFTLPDGSGCWLNSGSTLRYPVAFNRFNRKVTLSGEGFFEVVSNSRKPFVVNICDMEIIAIGTSFNVLYYPEDNGCEITLETGKLVIEKNDKNGKPVRVAELDPDHRIVMDRGGQIEVMEKVATWKYTSWKEGKLVFRNEPMLSVIKRMGRWYNIDIQLRDKELESYRYRMTFENETISEVLEMLKLTSPIDYIEHERETLQDGTYSQKKITLFLRK